MFNHSVMTILAVIMLSLSGTSTGLAGPGHGNGGGGDGGDSGDTSSLSQHEEEHLLFMREEEKLARDVYDQLFIDYGNLVFDNISNSEQNHMDAIKVLLDRYDLPDPILGPGVFADESLNDLWNDLMLVASQGEVWALVVGAWIEETDMVDIQIAIEETEHEDINSTYESLMCGSRNHLRAFIKNLQLAGITDWAEYGIPFGYVDPEHPEIYLDSDEYWSIALGEMETDCGVKNSDDDGGKGRGRNRN